MAEDGAGEKICSSERAEPDSLIEPEHNFPQPQLLNQSQLKCPQCGSANLYKDGLRYLSGGTGVQRWLCRNCGYRFTNHKNKARTGRKNPPSGLNPPFASYYSCQGNNDPDGRVPPRQKGATTLATVEKENEKRAAGATETNTMATLILDYAWNVKKRGLAEQTIKQRVCRLKQLIKRGANLLDPDSVLTVLATSNWTDSNKRVFIVAYKSFAKTFNIWHLNCQKQGLKGNCLSSRLRKNWIS